MQIKSKKNIIDHFNEGIKKKLFIGVENEKFLFEEKSNKRASYNKVRQTLENLKNNFQWEEVKEDGNLIGLKLGGKSISLEPGNQIELAGDKLENIHQVCSESYSFQDQLEKVCKKIGLKTLSVGYDPFTNLDDVPNNPKQRYKLMTVEMPKHGELSLNMMYQTSGTQINLDYLSEVDFKKKFKLTSYLTPLSVAIFANSPIIESKPSGYLSYRAKVWHKTSRGGLPKVFLENMDFEKYADYVINMPLLFIPKGNQHIFSKNKTFKDFMNGKIQEINNNLPTLNDLEIHLSTIFTEVRLKNYLEVRSLDACEWDCHCAGPAFLIGLLYGNLNESYEIINKWKKKDILEAYFNSPSKGFSTEIEGKSILDWSEIFLKLSKEGLKSRNQLNSKKNNEEIYLKNVSSMITKKSTKAEDSIKILNL